MSPSDGAGPGLLRRFPSLRLVTFSVLLCMIPLVLLTYLTIALADRALVREVNARVRTTSAVTAALLNVQMQSIAGFTSSYADRPILISALADGNPANFDDDVINSQLTQLAPPGSGGAFLADASCRLTQIRPSTPEIIGADLSLRDWCKGGTSTGRPYVSEAFRSALLGEPLVVAVVVTVRATVGDDASAPLGILGVVYPLDSIRGFADDLAEAQGVRLTITDQRGTILAGHAVSGNVQGLVSASSDPRVSEALAGRSGVIRSTGPDGDALSGFAPVADIGWTATAEVPAGEALAGVRALQSTTLSVAGAIGLLMLAGVILLARTLRQRREVERSLTEREATTRAILEAATDAFVSMDGQGVIRAWNRQAEHIFGWTEAEAVGRDVFDTVFPPEHRRHYVDRWTAIQAAGDGRIDNSRVEIVAQHRDGRQFPAEVAVWPVRSGEAWGFNAFVHDITDRKRVETDLAAARDAALAASQLKSEFLANMSHEIRTPMNGVLGMTTLLLDTDLGVEQREFAETVLASGEVLLSILNDILDFSKIEAGRLELEVVDFDLRGLVEGVTSLFGPAAHAKGLEIVCSLPVDMPAMVQGDPGRLRQIVTNLVGNAVKFTAVGEVIVELTMDEGGDSSASSVRIEVIDTGIGIAESNQAAVFESFSQADSGTTRRYGGTGLGLAIARQLVELMGGEIGVASALGRGTTFWFTVPLARGGPAAAAVPRGSRLDDCPATLLATPPPTTPTAVVPTAGGSAPPRRRSTGNASSGRILLAEDNPANQRVASAMLTNLGFEVDVVADGAEAVRAATGNRYRAILMDCQMPVMDGYEATGHIRSLGGEWSRTPIIAFTASAMESDVQNCLAAGMDDCLFKPVRLKMLAAVLARWAPDEIGPGSALLVGVDTGRVDD